MARVEWNPVARELESMKERMESLYSENFSEGDKRSSCEASREGDWNPAVDIWETEDEWVMVADLPGVREDNLHLEMDGGLLVLRAGRRDDAPLDALRLQNERGMGDFRRSFAIPEGACAESVSAEFRDGVLRVVASRTDARPSARRVALS